MENIMVTYDRNSMSLWDFGQLTLPFRHGLAAFSDQERRTSLGPFIHMLL